ncbi:MAG: protein-L-isoaspartate(D-aspartate) O-methyltransferase [Bacteroidota bacterium]
MKDTYRHQGLRKQLIQSLQKKGISDERILSAMRQLPRHFFLDKAFEERSYEDKAFPIGSSQTISQPFTVAYQTELLNVEKHQKVMEIGTGSGYQAAILKLLGGRVFSVERQEALHEATRKRLQSLGFDQIKLFWRDGYLGLKEYAPFDRILVTAGATEIPKALLEQLAIDGIMVIPVGPQENKVMMRITKVAANKFQRETFDLFRFVPFLKGINNKSRD